MDKLAGYIMYIFLIKPILKFQLLLNSLALIMNTIKSCHYISIGSPTVIIR